MTKMQVKPTERGLIRLFSVDLPPEKIKAFNTRTFDDDGDQTSWPLYDALGPNYLDEDFIEYFDVADLEGIGLTGYMTQGLGIADSEIAQDAARLSTLKGHVLIVFSAAFDGIGQTLNPRAPLRWIGTYTEEASKVSFPTLHSDAAKGTLAPPPPEQTNPHLTLLWAILALPVLALIVGTVIYGVTR